jgi:ATP-binding cassette subfamily B (MDR/TAP) protein 1
MTAIVICGTKYVSKFAKQASSFTEQATAVAESAFRGVQIVQAFGISERLAQNHINFLRKALRAGIKKGITGALMLGGVYFVAYAANALAFWYGDRLRQGSSEAGTIYAVVFLILDASFVVGQFGPFIQTFALAAAAGQSVSEILDHPTTKIDVYSEEGKVLQRADFRQDIKLQDITFVYPGRPTERVLEGVNLEIPAGKVTGLVGPSGSGKSTVSAILLRLYDPSRGKIKLGDDDLATANIKSLRENIALVTQSPVLFTGTILENIMLGLPEGEQITEVEAVARCAAAAADAHCDFLEHLPEGLYTQIGAGHHSQLSGGQKQRICLARALVGNPQVLILDEYTSALDATSEGVVLENLQRISAASGRTTIIIAHRLATVKNADRIIVMEHGAVAEMGSHEDLIKADGLYNELIKAQQFDKKRNASPSSSLASTANSSQNEISQPMKALASTSKPNTTIRHEAAKKRTGELIVRSLSMSRPEMVWIIIGLLASLVSGGVIIGEALIFGNLVQLLNDTSNSPQIAAKISFYCLLFFILAIVALVSRSCGGGAFGLVSENLVLRVRDVSFRTILTQDISWFSLPGHSHHNLMSKLNMDSGHISGLSGVILGTFFSIATSVIGGIILAHIIAWKIAIVLLAAVPIMVLAGFFRLRILAKAEERHQTAYNSAAAMASEACAAIQTVAALGRERYFFQKYRTAIQGPYQESLKISVLGNIMLAFSLSVTYFVYALAYWWYVKSIADQVKCLPIVGVRNKCEAEHIASVTSSLCYQPFFSQHNLPVSFFLLHQKSQGQKPQRRVSLPFMTKSHPLSSYQISRKKTIRILLRMSPFLMTTSIWPARESCNSKMLAYIMRPDRMWLHYKMSLSPYDRVNMLLSLVGLAPESRVRCT